MADSTATTTRINTDSAAALLTKFMLRATPLAFTRSMGYISMLLTVQKAQADAIRMINEANPNHNYLALRSMEAMEKVADGKATKLIVPSDMQNLAATVSAIKEISGEVTE